MTGRFVVTALSAHTGERVAIFSRKTEEACTLRINWYRRHLPGSYSDFAIEPSQGRRGETALERAHREGTGCGGLDVDGVRRLVEMSRENAAKP